MVTLGDMPGSGKTSYTRLLVTSPEAEAERPGTPAQISIGTMNGTASTRSSIRLVHSDGSITISSGSSITFNQGGSEITLPNKSGTIALTGDVKLYKFTVNLTVDDGFIVFELYSDSLLTYFTTGVNTISSNIPIIFKALFKGNVKGEIYLASGGYGIGAAYTLPLYIEYSSNSSIKVYTLNVSNLTTSSLNLAALISPIKQMEVIVRSIY